jgi:hypothetical protein
VIAHNAQMNKNLKKKKPYKQINRTKLISLVWLYFLKTQKIEPMESLSIQTIFFTKKIRLQP